LRRFVEVIIIGVGVSVISFIMPVIWGRCTELPYAGQDEPREKIWWKLGSVRMRTWKKLQQSCQFIYRS
jgi:hypothetical protein